jgi:hypothetical protein
MFNNKNNNLNKLKKEIDTPRERHILRMILDYNYEQKVKKMSERSSPESIVIFVNSSFEQKKNILHGLEEPSPQLTNQINRLIDKKIKEKIEETARTKKGGYRKVSKKTKINLKFNTLQNNKLKTKKIKKIKK